MAVALNFRIPKNSTRVEHVDWKGGQERSFEVDDRAATTVHTLIAESALNKACTALTADPPVSPTQDVKDLVQHLHPGPTLAHYHEVD